MEIKKFVPKEDLPAKERAISTLLDMLDEVHEKMKKTKGFEFRVLTESAMELANTIARLQERQDQREGGSCDERTIKRTHRRT